MKYVMFKRKLEGGLTEFVPVIFPKGLVHKEVADALQRWYTSLELHSAGEVTAFRTNCIGESTTLNLKPDKEEDEHRITMCDYGACISE